MYETLPVYKDVYALILLVYEATKEFPREYKYTLGQDRTYYIRRRVLQRTLRVDYLNHFYISGGYCKLVRKKRPLRKKYLRFLPVQSRPLSWEEVLARRRWLAAVPFEE